MALYSPIPPPTPRIIITEPTEHNASHVKWNRDYLTAIWIPQFLCLLFGMAVLPYQVWNIVSFQFLFICIAATGNVILVATPCVEAHKYAVGTLTPEFFHKLQVWKARWVGGGWVVIALVQGGMKYKSVWSVLWTLLADVLYLAPFAGGVWYARQVIKQAGGERDDDPENASVRL